METDDEARRFLRVYAALGRLDRIGYTGKILLVAFVGTHVPLLALLGWFLLAELELERVVGTLAVALAATLAGTALTLLTLRHLLRPISLTARGLRRYVADGTLPALPDGHADAAGTLMADTGYALARLDEARERLEHNDPVTGLANRTRLLNALEARSAEAGAAPFALCALSLVGLDEIASAFGRAEADRVLREAAVRLDAATPADAALYRVDTATLALVLDTDDPDRIVRALARVDGALERLGGDGLEHDLTCRRGVSLWPLDDRGPAALLDDALVALVIARRRDAPWTFYSEGSRRALVERYALARELRRALWRDELTLHYQPIVDAARERVVGAEALIRWHHPTRGLVPPGRFIPLAEESELIEEIGLWTLGEVCRRIQDWREDGLVVPRIAVNLSARQFADPELPARITELFARHDIRPGELEVELTETSATADVVEASETMATLSSLGVRLAIDDFGTGYSSLSHLRTMPFDKLKIDREFVSDADSNADHLAICRTLIALGRELGIEVLAEGAETAEEVVALRSLGCELFQGYHFHRPLTGERFERLLHDLRDDATRAEPVRGRLAS